jgi:hypothetical protein
MSTITLPAFLGNAEIFQDALFRAIMTTCEQLGDGVKELDWFTVRNLSLSYMPFCAALAETAEEEEQLLLASA